MRSRSLATMSTMSTVSTVSSVSTTVSSDAAPFASSRGCAPQRTHQTTSSHSLESTGSGPMLPALSSSSSTQHCREMIVPPKPVRKTMPLKPVEKHAQQREKMTFTKSEAKTAYSNYLTNEQHLPPFSSKLNSGELKPVDLNRIANRGRSISFDDASTYTYIDQEIVEYEYSYESEEDAPCLSIPSAPKESQVGLRRNGSHDIICSSLSTTVLPSLEKSPGSQQSNYRDHRAHLSSSGSIELVGASRYTSKAASVEKTKTSVSQAFTRGVGEPTDDDSLLLAPKFERTEESTVHQSSAARHSACRGRRTRAVKIKRRSSKTPTITETHGSTYSYYPSYTSVSLSTDRMTALSNRKRSNTGQRAMILGPCDESIGSTYHSLETEKHIESVGEVSIDVVHNDTTCHIDPFMEHADWQFSKFVPLFVGLAPHNKTNIPVKRKQKRLVSAVSASRAEMNWNEFLLWSRDNKRLRQYINVKNPVAVNLTAPTVSSRGGVTNTNNISVSTTSHTMGRVEGIAYQPSVTIAADTVERKTNFPSSYRESKTEVVSTTTGAVHNTSETTNVHTAAHKFESVFCDDQETHSAIARTAGNMHTKTLTNSIHSTGAVTESNTTRESSILAGHVAHGSLDHHHSGQKIIGSTTTTATTSTGLTNGSSVHGTTLHGSSVHGTTLHGSSVHGSTHDGSSIHGTTHHGSSIHGITLHGSSVHGTTHRGSSVHGVAHSDVNAHSRLAPSLVVHSAISGDSFDKLNPSPFIKAEATTSANKDMNSFKEDLIIDSTREFHYEYHQDHNTDTTLLIARGGTDATMEYSGCNSMICDETVQRGGQIHKADPESRNSGWFNRMICCPSHGATSDTVSNTSSLADIVPRNEVSLEYRPRSISTSLAAH